MKFDADPDLNLDPPQYFDANPNPDPKWQNDADPTRSDSGSATLPVGNNYPPK